MVLNLEVFYEEAVYRGGFVGVYKYLEVIFLFSGEVSYFYIGWLVFLGSFYGYISKFYIGKKK